ncbi:MAG: radical SAM protein [Desulfobacterales bacterium]|nr:radical SAM protein [Desulfobacterales bacterium]
MLWNILEKCSLCPRNCNSNRFSKKLGYCNTDANFNIASICLHKGEEPVLGGEKGICNIFFSHCNMQCIYCQNIQISRNIGEVVLYKFTLEEVIKRILSILDQGIDTIGFVSPSHNIPQVARIINELKKIGKHPTIVYNTNAYDKAGTLRMIEGLIDVYLPDFKYIDNKTAKEYSDAPDYPDAAKKAIKEMHYQKGSSLRLDDNGVCRSGIIIRHLVLPNHVSESLKILEYIAYELSPNIHISIMSQYFPIKNVENHPILKRNITKDEYEKLILKIDELGFSNGWIQDMHSPSYYLPDFKRDEPFQVVF